eukprot:GHVS01028169.1.p1 GENE.GHVS01028169.1~~GHVS01028169.1.p1  ORF type:complete len:232 (+),score=27.16 GHVS01028169.1:67-762(+)
MLATFRKSVVVVLTMACVYASGVASSSEGDSSARGSAVITLTDSNFEHDTQAASGSTTGDWFVLFHSPNCGHCHKVMPAWEELGNVMKGRMNIAKVDVSANRATSGRFGFNRIPVFTLFRHGKMYKLPAGTERTLESLRSFAEGGYDEVMGEAVPKSQTMFEFAQELLTAATADAQKVYNTFPHVLLFAAGGGALAAMALMMMLRLCCWAMCGKSGSSQAPSSRKRTHKKD